MRTALLPMAVALALGTSGCERESKVDRIEMRLSGPSGADISVNSRGNGEYRISDYPDERSGSFSITSEQFAKLAERTAPFRRQALPFTDESARKIIEQTCPDGAPSITDAGGVWLHWVGPDSDEHYFADLGCDSDQHASRNNELLSIVKSLPIPLDR